MWKALKSVNLNVPAKLGYCLQYAHDVFGIGAKYPTAWQAWEHAQYKHTDQNFPPVPVLASFSGANGDGHIEVHVPGVGFSASPYNRATGHEVLATIAEVEQHYGVKYVGWAEDINGVRVAEQVADPAPTPKPAPSPTQKMPGLNDRIQLLPTQTRTTFKVGTTQVAGHIHVTNDNFVYIVRGRDPKYPYRVIIDTASGGGDHVALALYYTNGKNIGGWKEL